MKSAYFLICAMIVSSALAAKSLAVPSSESVSDLNPVSIHDAPSHAPLVLVEEGQARAKIVVPGGITPELRPFLDELQLTIALTTGAELEITTEIEGGPSIIIGDCREALALGLDGSDMPIESFAIKTSANAVHIVGNDPGNLWGIVEFMERFVDVRWFWPADRGGRSIQPRPDLIVSPVHLTDAPAFRKRHDYPPAGNGPDGTRQILRHQYSMMRNAETWPVSIRVHRPGVEWEHYRTSRPEIFALRTDGTRHGQMYCYSHPLTLQTFLEEIEAHYAGRELPTFQRGGATFIYKDSISVSPPDVAPTCACEACQKLWRPEGGQYAAATYALADFVQRLATTVQERWPDKTIIYLPYQNYTEAPEGVSFPGNVEVQICGMPGFAQYKEPRIMAWEQEQLEKWYAITGRPVQNWHYSCWPADRIRAPYQYPHVLQNYYRKNRDILVGTFINGTKDHWPRHHISLYAWHKLMWNPDYDVNAGLAAYTKRMYGPAAGIMRELVYILIDGWQDSRWVDGVLTPGEVYAQAYPPPVMARIQELLAAAETAIGDDAELRRRLDYFKLPFDAFFKEYRLIVHGEGIRSVTVMRVDEPPVLDGRLDDAAWERAVPTDLVVHTPPQGEREPNFPSTARVVWTPEALYIGMRLTEPETGSLATDIRARDDSLMWHQDCIEVFLNVSGENDFGCYQFIFTAGGAIWDAAPGGLDGRSGDAAAWDLDGLDTAVAIEDGYWTIEVRLPIAGFKDALRPGTGVSWNGQITRHRNRRGKTVGDGENQKINATFGGRNNNTTDFAPFVFVE